MTVIALLALIAQVIMGVPKWVELIKDLLETIDSQKTGKERFAARARLGQILRDRRDGKTCDATCEGNLAAFKAELRKSA